MKKNQYRFKESVLLFCMDCNTPYCVLDDGCSVVGRYDNVLGIPF